MTTQNLEIIVWKYFHAQPSRPNKWRKMEASLEAKKTANHELMWYSRAKIQLCINWVPGLALEPRCLHIPGTTDMKGWRWQVPHVPRTIDIKRWRWQVQNISVWVFWRQTMRSSQSRSSARAHCLLKEDTYTWTENENILKSL